ncbi:hypothetical protein AB0P15_16865 [Streptomyces sp. NPDC087917]|uniref:hypothetical protein n=1 Tax=Streptomyces sp. NPDC087917 TaxID=3155060 RepID=UPI00341A5B28
MSETEQERPGPHLAEPAPPPSTSPVAGIVGIADGVVELRKRGELTARQAGPDAGSRLETMARRAAERAGRPHA